MTAVMDPLEQEAFAAYQRGQAEALLRHHALDDVILLRLLDDERQGAVRLAHTGALGAARRLLAGIAAVPLPASAELRAADAVSARPADALVAWLDGDDRAALAGLDAALGACALLAARYGHAHLTARQLTLAAHAVRVRIGDAATVADIGRLRAVVAGDRDAWPHPGGAELTVPLRGGARRAVAILLDKLAARAKAAVA